MMKKRITVDIEVLRHWFIYEPETGLIRWRVKPKGHRRKAGDVAGNIDKTVGYIQIRLDYQKLYGHRVAWALYHGRWPEHEIDHINLNRSDNRICNLRDVTHWQNSLNQPQPKRQPKTGVLGIYLHHNRYVARFIFNGTRYYVGRFMTKEEAKAAYDAKYKQVCGDQPRSYSTFSDPAGGQDDRDTAREPF